VLDAFVVVFLIFADIASVLKVYERDTVVMKRNAI
jgi:hypothetical protein